MTSDSGAVPFDLLEPRARPFFDRWGPGLVTYLPARPAGAGGPPHGGAWLQVGADGRVRAFAGKVELGQGVGTALTLLVAEELRVPIASVDVILGDTDTTPWDMGTFGSRSIADAGTHLRAVAAAALTLLRARAAERLRVEPGRIQIEAGRASAGTGATASSVGFAELVSDLTRIEPVPSGVALSDPARWTAAGHPAASRDGPKIVTGALAYASDLRLEGMWEGAVLFPPVYRSTLKSLETRAAEAIPGVTVVREGNFVGVAARDRSTALEARALLRAEWEVPEVPGEDGVVEYLRAHPTAADDHWDLDRVSTGDPEAARRTAALTHAATYTTAYIAHVPLETHAAVANWTGDRLTVWLGSQTPFRARAAVARALGIPPEQVRIVVPPTGGGFGGKHAEELAAGAARLARASGHPVRVTLSREEEFTQTYLRPMAVVDLRSAVDREGRLAAWECINWNAGASALRPPYRIDHQRVENRPTLSPLRQGSYRALAATANNFARESHLDELARLAGVDPVEFRRRHLDDPRLIAVLDAVIERAGWTARPSRRGPRTVPATGRGIAIGVEKGGRVATYAELRVGASRTVELRRIITAYECGAIVHPRQLTAQVEGGTIMALGGALWEAIHFDRGRILNGRLSAYRVPRFLDIPPIEVLLLDRPDLPSAGGGETPLIAVAPAIANAIDDATGVRIRQLPMLPGGRLPTGPGSADFSAPKN